MGAGNVVEIHRLEPDAKTPPRLTRFLVHFAEPGLYKVELRLGTRVSDSETLVDSYSWLIDVLGSGLLCNAAHDCIIGSSIEYKAPSGVLMGLVGGLFPAINGHPVVENAALTQDLMDLRIVPSSLLGDLTAAIEQDFQELPIHVVATKDGKKWVTRASVRDLFLRGTFDEETDAPGGRDPETKDRIYGWCVRMLDRAYLITNDSDWAHRATWEKCTKVVERHLEELSGTLSAQRTPEPIAIKVDDEEEQGPADRPDRESLLLVRPPSTNRSARPTDIKLAAGYHAFAPPQRTTVHLTATDPTSDAGALGDLDIWTISPRHMHVSGSVEVNFDFGHVGVALLQGLGCTFQPISSSWMESGGLVPSRRVPHSWPE